MERVLVTGGAGYVGSVLVPKLIDLGYDVRVSDLMIYGEGSLESVKDRCHIVKGDIRDRFHQRKCLRGINAVIHLAAISNDPSAELNTELTEQVNFHATKRLLRMSQSAGVTRFIYASSGSVYGLKDEEKVTEDLPLNPLTVYSRTKALAEKSVAESSGPGFTTVSLRPATICGYSPRLRLDLTVNLLTERAINHNSMTVFGGSQQRPNLHIEDMADFYIALLRAPSERITGEVFNAGYENNSVMQMALLIRSTLGTNAEIATQPTDDLRSYRLDSEKIQRVLGLVPKKGIADAVRDLRTAFESGLIPNPEDNVYRNVRKMKEIGLK